MRIRTAVLTIILIVALFAGWKYAYLPLSERQVGQAQAKKILASRIEELSFIPLLPKKLPSGFYLHAPELLMGGGEENLRIQYTRRGGTVLDLYERAVKEGEDLAVPFRDASHWQERKDALLKEDIPAYVVRGRDEKIELLIGGKPQNVTLQMAMLAFSHKGTRVVISNSAFLENTLLSEEELIEFANSMIEG